MLFRLLIIVVCLLASEKSIAVSAMLPTTERVLLAQDIELNHTSVKVRVWLDSRQVFQQQGLRIHISAEYDPVLGQVSLAQLKSSQSSDWAQPIVQDASMDYRQGDKQVSEWVGFLFPRQLGVLSLPNIQFQLEGKSFARKWLSIPAVAIRVMPLPVFVPTEAVVGKLVEVVDLSDFPRWTILGDRLERKTQLVIEGYMPNSLQRMNATGVNVQGMSSLVDVVRQTWQGQQVRSTLQLWQPWQPSESGKWVLAAQNIWVFDPDTWQVMHIVLPEYQGWAVPVWVWYGMQIVVLVVVVLMVLGLVLWLWCKHKRYRYLQAIAQTQDVQQLVSVLRQRWHLPLDVPFSHALPSDHALYALMSQLEGMFFSPRILHGDDFHRLKIELLKKDVFPRCVS